MSELYTARLLIVDDESALMNALCEILNHRGFETVGFSDGRLALEELRKSKFDLLLADLMMPVMDGITLLGAALEIDADLVGVIMTGQGTIDSAVQAMKVGAVDYILKPFKLSVILPVLTRALDIRRLRLENIKLERYLRQRTTELEAAYKELESFSYSISHDLRAPLRAIDGFSTLLINDFSNKMPEDAVGMLHHVASSAHRMQEMTDGLLRFSRLSRQPLAKRTLSVSAMISEILQDFSKEQQERPVNVHVNNLPDCVGDVTLLRHVFYNLLSNAFKFTRKSAAARIEVGCTESNGEKVYFVRDNGVGFDVHYATRLFGVFQRLHNDEAFEGTGVGLSIVQRIVERHGGKVRAEAEVGNGATFFVTLPDSDPPSELT